MFIRMLSALLFVVLAPLVSAQDSYYRVRLADLDLGGGVLPAWPATAPWESMLRYEFMWPCASLEGEGEAYVERADEDRFGRFVSNFHQRHLVVRSAGPGDVRGSLSVPSAEWSRMVRWEFTIPASAADAEAKDAFHRAQAVHHRLLSERGLPGAAWFRHRAAVARESLPAGSEALTRVRAPGMPGASDLEDTYSLFTGGRAVSENIQLDRLIPAAELGGDLVALDTIEGITVKELDWEPLLDGPEPKLDPLASLVPADQHALFFPSFDAMVALADEARDFGAPVLAAWLSNTRDALTRERYERQLCLSLDAWARTFGPMAVQSMVFTGSDPYLRTGSDVALVYQAKSPEALFGFVRARQAAAKEAESGVEDVEGDVAGYRYAGVVSPTRRVCSYVSIVGEAVVVTNSLHQLGRIAAAARWVEPSLAVAPEYHFFRNRYPRDDAAETALLVVPDEAIRRWCGPRWRIATSRRTQAAAALAELQAAHLEELAAGPAGLRPVDSRPSFPVMGNLHLTSEGVWSTRYGSLDFQTPIAELDLTKVGKREAELYERWRDGYQRNWSGFFDPIAARFTVADGRVGFDMTIMPLILGTDYEDFIELVGESELDPLAADPHAESLFHFAMALDADSPPIQDLGEALSSFVSEVANPMDWLGDSWAFYVDRDPIWEDIAAAGSVEEALENAYLDLNDLPVVAYFAVSSPLRLAGFLNAVRTMVEDTTPGLVKWETRSHGERKYVQVTGDGIADDLSIFYATLPTALLVSLQEEALQRAIDRLAPSPDEPDAVTDGTPTPEPEPWLGRSVAVTLDRDGIRALQSIFDEDAKEQLRLLSWANLPILNEWKRLFPDRDPMAVHEELWGERLVCPAGGAYVWNDEWRTMESTVCGHPGVPAENIDWPAILGRLRRARAGLTFELDGLRAVVDLTRDS